MSSASIPKPESLSQLFYIQETANIFCNYRYKFLRLCWLGMENLKCYCWLSAREEYRGRGAKTINHCFSNNRLLFLLFFLFFSKILGANAFWGAKVVLGGGRPPVAESQIVLCILLADRRNDCSEINNEVQNTSPIACLSSVTQLMRYTR